MELREVIEGKDHIIWDWNGTILNDVDHAVRCMNILLENHDLPTITLDRYKKIFRFPIKSYYDQLGFDYTVKSFESLCHEFVELFMDDINSCKPDQKIERHISEVSELGKKQSVLSATDQENLDRMIDLFGFEGIFSHVYGIQDKLGASKVERGKELISESLVPRERTVMIGDTLHDLEVAEELNIDVVLVSNGHQCYTILKDNHHHVLEI